MMKTPMKIWHGESGMAVLGVVLMLVIVGGLMLPVLLYFMGTASKAGQIVERKTKEYYSANSGIDAAMWRIKTNDKLPGWLDAINWGESVYGHASENYTLSSGDPINDNSVVYQIGPKWVLEGLEDQNPTQKRNPGNPANEVSAIVMAGSYKGTGTAGHGQYEIIIMYDGTVGSLGIKRIGCWLPPGFDYVSDSSSLEKTGNPVKPYLQLPVQVTPYRGGHTIIWNFSQPVNYNLFLPPGSQRKVTFEITPNQGPQGEFCWLRTNNTVYNELAWNTDLKVFEVKSTATSPSGQTTTATAYTTKKEFQKFGAAMEGDYYAVGNTLMRYQTAPDGLSRERLYEKTWSTVSAIPANANVEKIFLYWSGWKCKPWDTTTYTQADYKQKIEVEKKVNKVKLTISGVPGVTDYTTTVTASQTQGAQNKMDYSPYPMGWSYSCYADITSVVLAHMGSSFVGNGTYTVGHWDTSLVYNPSTYRYRLYNWIDGHPHEEEHNNYYTRYPLGSPMDGCQTNNGTDEGSSNYCCDSRCRTDCSPHQAAYGAWSVVIIYTSPSTKGHQIYIYDTLEYVVRNTFTPKVVTISGFLTPDLTNEPEAARITTFIGEGDGASNQTDSLSINGSSLGDLDNLVNNICNSKSRIPPGTYPDPLTLIDGIDIDTFSIANGIVNPNDTEATVRFTTGPEGLDIIYFIMSFRSKITSGGIFIYNVQ